MRTLHEDEGRTFVSLHLQGRDAFVSPFAGADFILLLQTFEGAVTAAQQQALSEAFVAQGCRYAVCTGHACSSWDDSIDEAAIRADIPDERFIMTTWHEDESLEDVAEFFVLSTTFDDFVPSRFLVACLGGTAEDGARLDETVMHVIRDC